MQRDDPTEQPSVEQPFLPLYAPEPDSQVLAPPDDTANETVEEGTPRTSDWLLACMMETYNQCE